MLYKLYVFLYFLDLYGCYFALLSIKEKTGEGGGEGIVRCSCKISALHILSTFSVNIPILKTTKFIQEKIYLC
jgi:hypothetical protein